MGKRELYTEASFVLFFRISCLRWREAGGGWLVMKYASVFIRIDKGLDDRECTLMGLWNWSKLLQVMSLCLS